MFMFFAQAHIVENWVSLENYYKNFGAKQNFNSRALTEAITRGLIIRIL